MSKRISIVISDPWDLVTACGSGPFAGTCREEAPYGVLVELDEFIKYEGTNYNMAFCHLRHADTAVADIYSGREISVNIGLVGTDASVDVKTVTMAAINLMRGIGAVGSVRVIP